MPQASLLGFRWCIGLGGTQVGGQALEPTGQKIAILKAGVAKRRNRCDCANASVANHNNRFIGRQFVELIALKKLRQRDGFMSRKIPREELRLAGCPDIQGHELLARLYGVNELLWLHLAQVFTRLWALYGRDLFCVRIGIIPILGGFRRRQ